MTTDEDRVLRGVWRHYHICLRRPLSRIPRNENSTEEIVTVANLSPWVSHPHRSAQTCPCISVGASGTDADRRKTQTATRPTRNSDDDDDDGGP